MRHFTIATLLGALLITRASHTQTVVSTTQVPTSKADVGPWAAAIVSRAAQLISTPEHWDKKSTGVCPAHAQTFSLQCALQHAADHQGSNQPEHSECRFHATKEGQEGSCGVLFDENPIFTLVRVPGITTGFWRRDAKSSEIWAGKMSDAASPVMYEARQVINMMTTKKYSARLVDYNNDPETTFTDLQKFFRLVEDRVCVLDGLPGILVDRADRGPDRGELPHRHRHIGAGSDRGSHRGVTIERRVGTNQDPLRFATRVIC